MLEYAFMQKAFIAGLCLGIVIPLIGVVVVLKRLSMIGDSLSHASLAGVAGGLVFGISPVFGALIACVSAAFCIEGIRFRFKERAELAIAVVMSLSIGLAAVFSSFVPNAANFTSYLFGSLVALSFDELVVIVGLCMVVSAIFLILYRSFYLISLDERLSRLAGVRTNLINALFVLMCALVVSIAAQTVGVLIVSSMMVIPVACGLQLARSFKQLCIISALVGFFCSGLGLTLSFYANLRPGGAIVLCSVAALALSFSFAFLKKRVAALRHNKLQTDTHSECEVSTQ